MLIKTISSMEKVLPCVIPTEIENEGIMFSNERFNFQIAMQNDSQSSLKFLKVKISGILDEYLSLRTVELVPLNYLLPSLDDYYITTTPTLMPDLLKPFGNFGLVLPCNQWRSVFVTIHSKNGIPQGNYNLKIEIINTENNTIASCDYSLQVLGESLPETDLKLTNWIHYDCISQKHNVELFSDDFYKVFNNYLKTYLDCGQNMLFTPLFTPPLDTKVGFDRQTAQLIGVKKTKNGYEFSFDELKKFIDFATSHGIKFIEFSHLFTQWGGKFCPKIMAETENGYEKIFGWETASDSKKYVEFLDAFLPLLIKNLKDWGVVDKCYFHLTDEPHIEHLPNYAKCREIVKKHIKDRPIMDAMSSFEFYEKGLVDIPIPATYNYVDFKDKNIQNMFVYYYSFPCAGYYSNRTLGMPLQRTRILGLQLYASGVQGFLHWGFNFYNTAFSVEEVDPYADTSAGGIFPSGDSFIVYPNKDGLLMTIRAECINEAIQDYRLCLLLEKKIGKTAVQQLLYSFEISDYNVYPRSVTKHNEIRKKLIEYVMK